MSEVTNDNHSKGQDPHGEAALLLVESLIHGLIFRSVIDAETAVEIVDIASEVEVERAGEAGTGHAGVQTSSELLLEISKSLRTDVK